MARTPLVQTMGSSAGNGDGDLSCSLPVAEEECLCGIAAITGYRCNTVADRCLASTDTLRAPFAGIIPGRIWHCTPCEENGLLGMTPSSRLPQPRRTIFVATNQEVHISGSRRGTAAGRGLGDFQLHIGELVARAVGAAEDVIGSRQRSS